MKRIILLEIQARLGLAKRLDVDFVGALASCRRLARKHHRLAEMDCNGYGYVKGHSYYAGNIDQWAKKEYGNGVKSAYINPQRPDDTIFTVESERVEDKIKRIWENAGGIVEFQGDPRGATVKLSMNGKDMTDLIWE